MIKVIICDNLPTLETYIYIMDFDEKTGEQKIAKSIKLDFYSYNEEEIMKPTLSFKRHQGNQFLSELSSALIASGYRDKVSDKDGEIKRMNNHLEDMRQIAFKFINNDKKNKE